MTTQELRDILQIGQVDAGNNTLFEQAVKFPVAEDHLTLIISSGGSGSASIMKVIDAANQKLSENYKKYVKFIVVDSAKEELDAINEAYGSAIETVSISQGNIGDRIKPGQRPTFYKSFIPGSFPYAALDMHGSGAKRLFGKVKFYDKASSSELYNDDVLRGVIANLYANDWSALKDLPVDVMVIAGLYGGNGSGTFEDIAVNARYAVERAKGKVGEVYGYLFLPDSSNIEDSKASNTYAALKELENYMSVKYDHEERFASQNTSITIDSKRMFDVPVLITGKKEESQNLLAESILNMIVSVGKIGGDGDDKGNKYLQKSFYSNRDTVRHEYLGGEKRRQDGVLVEGFYPEESRRYAGIGYAYAAIPSELVTANIVSYAVTSAYKVVTDKEGITLGFCTADARSSLTEPEMEKQIKHLFNIPQEVQLDESSLWAVLNQKLQEILENVKNNADISRKEIKSGKIDEYDAGFHMDDNILEGYEKFNSYLTRMKDNFFENSRQVMQLYGPYAMYLLYTGIGPDDDRGEPTKTVSIKGMLSYANSCFNQIKADPSVNDAVLLRAGFFRRLGEITGINEDYIIKWKNDYTEAKRKEVRKEIVEKITKPKVSWDTLKKYIEGYIGRCKVFDERLEMMRNFYYSCGSVLDSNDMQEFVDRTNQDNLVNLCDNAEIFKWVQEVAQERKKQIIEADVRNDIIESFMAGEISKTTNPWESNQIGITRKEFDSIMSRCCRLGRNAEAGKDILLSATAYFEHELEKEQPAVVQSKADVIAKRIVQQLIEKSKPSLKLRAGAYYGKNCYILIPNGIYTGGTSKFSENIKAALDKAFTEAMGTDSMRTNQNAQIIPSESVTDIVCYQTNVAVALSDLMDLSIWENKYHSIAAGGACRHLYQGEGEYGGAYVEWTKSQTEELKNGGEELELTDQENIIFGKGLSLEHYPSVNMCGLENNSVENSYMRDVFNPILEYALKEKIIERVDLGSSTKYLYQMLVLPENWKLNVSGYRIFDENGRLKRGRDLFTYLAGMNAGDGRPKVITRNIVIESSVWFDSEGFDFKDAIEGKLHLTIEDIERLAKRYLKRILRKNTDLYVLLRETLNRYYSVAAQLNDRESGIIMKDNIKTFQECYSCKVIEQSGDEWFASYEEGVDQCFLNGTRYTKMQFSKLESRLNDEYELNFIIAIRRAMSQLDFDALRKSAMEKAHQYEEEARDEELDVIVRQRNVELEEMRSRILEAFQITMLSNFTEVRAKLRKALRTGMESQKELKELDYYIQIIEEVLNQFPKKKDSEPIKIGSRGSVQSVTDSTGWECPSCKVEVDNRYKFCPECGTRKPELRKWKCVYCGSENEGKFRFCPECGNEKVVQQEEADWNCPNCGTENKARFKFCLECGTARQ